MHQDVWVEVLAMVGGGFLIAFVVWVSRARGLDIVTRQGARAWETVAEANERRIAQLESTLKEQETSHARAIADAESVRIRHDELVKLNLQLQTTNAQQVERIGTLEGQNKALQQTITTLETSMAALRQELEYLRAHAAPGQGINGGEQPA